AADRLPLYGKLNMLISDLFAHRSIKAVGFTASACRRASPSVEKCKINIVTACNSGKLGFCFVDRPVGHQVAAVFCTVGETKHDYLPSPSFLEMFLIKWMGIKPFHYFSSGF